MNKNTKIAVRDIVVLSLLSAVLFTTQVALSFLPNVEITSLLIIIYTLFYRKKTLYVIYTFTLLEGLYYGFGVWWIMYLYVWTILWGIIMITYKKNDTSANSVLIAFISGFYGLFFGTLCSVPYFFIGGAALGLSFIASGLLFDVIHGIGNFLVALILFKPICSIFNMLNTKLK